MDINSEGQRETPETHYYNPTGESPHRFLERYGRECYHAVVAEFGGDVVEAREWIEHGFVIATSSFADFMEHRYFDMWQGKLDEENHPFLRAHIDYDGLARALWKAGLIRVVPFEGLFYFFESPAHEQRHRCLTMRL